MFEPVPRRGLSLAVFTGALLLAWTQLLSGSEVSAVDTTQVYDRDADLEQLAWWVSMEHSFSDSLHRVAQQIIADHRANSTAFTDAEFYMEVRRIVALPDNGHTNVSGKPISQQFGLLPLRTYWFEEGLTIIRTKNQYRDLLGAHIQAINGIPLDELQIRLMDWHGGNAGFFRYYTAGKLMLSPPLLHAIELSESSSQLTLSLKTRTGEIKDVDVPVDPETSSIDEWAWRYQHPALIENEEDWSTIHEPSASLPLYLEDVDKLFRYVLIGDGHIAYIQLRANMGMDGDLSIDDFLFQTREQLERDRPHSIIFDNRHNPGGDLTGTADFALALPALAKPEGRVYVLTGSGTFSAGIYTSFFPEAADPQCTIIVSEHEGDRVRFWAETSPSFVLRDSGYRIVSRCSGMI